MASQVKDLMTSDVARVDPHASLLEAARLMRDEDVGGVVVADGSELVGLLTDRDIAVRGVAENCNPESTEVTAVASKDLETLKPDDDLDAAVALMRERAVRRAPVVDNGEVVGILSLGDLAREKDRKSALADISSAPPNH
jgi:CBS domain-containing protein